MAEVSAFEGIRYRPEVAPLEAVLCPPYDVISPELQLELYGRATQNMVRIELGRDFEGDVPGQQDRYTRARGHLDAWRQLEVLVRDEAPSLYLHRHSFTNPDSGAPVERLGCFAGVQPVPHDRGEVLRHELTLSAPRSDRLQLLRATELQTSPVFLLYEGAAEVTGLLTRLSASMPPAAEGVVSGELGPERHCLWRVSDPEVLERISGSLSRSRLYIADGHHRYETALGLGLRRVLALLAPLQDAGNVILPTHRVVDRCPSDAATLSRELGARGWAVEVVFDLEAARGRLRQLRAGHHAFALADGATITVAARPRDDSGDARQRLDVAVLESEILGPLLRISPDDIEARISYSRNPAEALSRAQRNQGVAVLLNPTGIEELAAVARAGLAMPQKSTYFYPKVPAGLVMMELE